MSSASTVCSINYVNAKQCMLLRNLIGCCVIDYLAHVMSKKPQGAKACKELGKETFWYILTMPNA